MLNGHLKRDANVDGQARAGEIKNMTGIGSPYEAPLMPEVVLDTDESSVDESSNKLLAYLTKHGYLKSPTEGEITERCSS